MDKSDHRKIFIIEDSEVDFITIKKAIQRANIPNPIIRYADASSALDFLQSENLSVELPGLILLDLNLPGIDGKEFLRRIRSDDKLNMIPTIVLSTSADERDVSQCYSLGANSYIQKPIEFNGFVEAFSVFYSFWFETSILPSK